MTALTASHDRCLLSACRHVHWHGRPTADSARRCVLRHYASDESLTFTNALHLEGKGIHGLIEPAEPVHQILRK